MGEADPAVRRALAAWQDADESRRDTYLDVVVAMTDGARLFMPAVPQPDGQVGAAVLADPDGHRALLAFTGIDSLTAWNGTARPVPGSLGDLSATVVEVGAEAVLVDVAGPVPFVVGPDLLGPLQEGARLVRLDDGYGWAHPVALPPEA